MHPDGGDYLNRAVNRKKVKFTDIFRFSYARFPRKLMSAANDDDTNLQPLDDTNFKRRRADVVVIVF